MIELMTMRCMNPLTMVVCILSSTNCCTLALMAVGELSSIWWKKPEAPLTVWLYRGALLREVAADWSHLPQGSVPLLLLLLHPLDTPSRAGHRNQEAANSPTNTSTCFRHIFFNHYHALVEVFSSAHQPTAAQASAVHVSHGEASG